MSRMKRKEYYMRMALLAAERATCKRKKVGCILTYKNRVVATGYCGVPSGVPHCTDTECLIYDGHCIQTVHAEINCLSTLQNSYDNLICYVTTQPCLNCYKALVSFGVKQIYYYEPYSDIARDKLITVYRVEMERVKIDDNSTPKK